MASSARIPRHPRSTSLCLGLILVLACATGARAAQPAVGLGTATSFAVLGGSTVTNTGPSVINGNLGVSPGGSIVGFPPGIVNGTVHAVDAVADQAQADLTVAYDDASGRGPAAVLPADIGGLFLTAGVYRRAAALQLTGNTTFDAQGDPAAVFIVQIGSALTTASNSHVLLVGGAQPCNIFWQIGSSATLGTNTEFVGIILSRQSITQNTGATVEGRVLARNGAVTLDTNTVNRGTCTAGATPGGAAPPGGGSTAGPGGTSTPVGTAPPSAATAPGSGSGAGAGGASNGGGATGGPGAPAGGVLAGATGAALLTTAPAKVASTVSLTGTDKCVDGWFQARVRGVHIRSVDFLIDGDSVAVQRRAPFAATIRLLRGTHKLRAHVAFTDHTPARNITFRFRACTRQTRRISAPVPSFVG
jgi:hypothetical protein